MEISNNSSNMLTEMCQQVLSTVDIKAICKNRGFSSREASSRTLLESYFLSEIGVEAALASLSQKEITLLHLLNLEGEPVDIRFFARLSPTKGNWHNTFTQRYTPVFKMVQNALIRKGLLLIAMAPGAETKMERWRFRFPREFAAFLPPICQHTVNFDVVGDVRHTTLRQKVTHILQDHHPPASDDQNEYPVTLANGQLLIENQPFSVNALLKWQQDQWQRWVAHASGEALKKSAAKLKPFRGKPFPPLVNYALAQLKANEWVSATELSTLLQLFYHGTQAPDSLEVCDVGWKLGCLAKHTTQGKEYYRRAPPPEDANQDPKHYLSFTTDSELQVDLETISYQNLACLATISELKVVDSRLIAAPHPIKLSRASETIWNYPLTVWLRNNSTASRKLSETIQARRGKLIIHTDLALARVKDLSLKVELQKAFSDPTELVLLPNDFIAFPSQRLGDIQRLIGKSGYVIKTIKAS